MNGSKDQQVNIAQWIANAIADTGCTVVFGTCDALVFVWTNVVVFLFENSRLSFGSASSILLTLSNDEGASLTYYEYCILLYMIIYYI
jgi:hypothetical protein